MSAPTPETDYVSRLESDRAEAEVSRLRAELAEAQMERSDALIDLAEARAVIERVTALLADGSVIGTLNGHGVPLPMVHKADLRAALAQE